VSAPLANEPPSAAAAADGIAFVPGPLRPLAVGALAIACAALVALAAVEVWQVVARYVLDAPAAWTEPVALVLLKLALMLAAAVGVRHDAHFRFALLAQAAGRWRTALEHFARLAAGAIGVALAVWGARLMLATWDVKAAGAPLSTGLNYAPFVAGGLLIALFALERVLRSRGD
jgi:TRAP-type C4-dicarboxylate transport system permease small subunit